LPETLKHLAAQNIPNDIACEIIVVDNGSTDHTSDFVLESWQKYNSSNITLNVIQEATPGKLFALKKGIMHAKYEYFIICDDDNWLSPDYIKTAFNILENNPEIGAAGGQAIAVTESGVSFPSWFEANKRSYAVGEQIETHNTPAKHLWGAGLVSRTSLYKETYEDFPSLLLVSQNKKILSTEDTEYCLRLIIKGYTLLYDPSLSLRHFISSERLTLRYKEELQRNFRDAHAILEKYYVAIKLDKKKLTFFNKIRLSIITPMRMLLKKNNEKEKTIMSYLFPGFIRPDPVTLKIRQKLLQ